MSANDQDIIAVTGRAHCQRQVAFLLDYTQKSTTPILALKLSVSAVITPGGLPQVGLIANIKILFFFQVL